jgi:hypothetical protein
MSNQTVSQKPYADKSLNGIITYDDGAGTVISGGTITVNTLDVTTLDVNNIQGKAPADNITLYTNTTGNIRLGELSTNLNTISGATLDLRSTDLVFDTNNDTDFETGNNLLMNTVGVTDIISTQITLNASGKVRIGGGQDLEPVTPANPMYIGKDITSANLFLGNATYPPSCTATATLANEICNYSTVQSLVAGGGSSILSSNNTFTGSNTFTQPLLCDSYEPTSNVLNIGTTPVVINDITIGSSLSRTTMQGSQVTISTLRSDEIRAINNVSHNLFANTLASNTADINIGTAVLAHTNTLNLSANDGVCNIGTISGRTADVNILTGSPACSGDFNVGTGTGFAGDVRIANNSSVPNTVSIGSVSTTNTLIGANLNLNTSGNGNTKINNTASQTGNVSIGNANTTTTAIAGAIVNINSNSNGNVNIASVLNTTSTITLGNNSANCTLNIGRQMTPTYTYTDANGANVATAIGYYNESVSFTTTTINSTTTGMLNFSIPDDGVWLIIFSVRVESNNTSSSSVSRLAIGLGETSGDFNYCEFWSGTAVVSGTTAATKTYLAPLCTHVDRFPAGKGVWVNALGNGNNGIRALIKSAKWTRLA